MPGPLRNRPPAVVRCRFDSALVEVWDGSERFKRNIADLRGMLTGKGTQTATIQPAVRPSALSPPLQVGEWLRVKDGVGGNTRSAKHNDFWCEARCNSPN